MLEITYHDDFDFQIEEVLSIYTACGWSCAQKPDQLFAALQDSHSIAYARSGDRMIGIGNAISDGHLVVYYPHLLVHPDFERMGVGSGILSQLSRRYVGFHQQMISADADAVDFYERNGFTRAGRTVSMWIYDGDEH